MGAARTLLTALLLGLLSLSLALPALAAEEEDFDIDAQLDALGRSELMAEVPEETRELLEEAELYELTVDSLLGMTPGQFFRSIWRMLVDRLKAPLRTLASMLGVVVLCALLGAFKTASGDSALTTVFHTVAVLCILSSIAAPILDCIVQTAAVIRQAANFMLSFVPMFSAAMISSGQPVSGAAYNVFLLSACQVISQVVAQTLIPMMSIYLALCIVGALVPELNMASAAKSIKTAVSWALGFLLTVFVALLSVQTMVAQGADTVSVRTTKFLIGSFVPVVGSVLSEAFTAAQGCLKLIRTTVGAYGIIVALFLFLPILLQVTAWYLTTQAVAIASDIAGVPKVGEVIRSCANVLGVLLAALLCFALLIIVSTTIVMVTGMGGHRVWPPRPLFCGGVTIDPPVVARCATLLCRSHRKVPLPPTKAAGSFARGRCLVDSVGGAVRHATLSLMPRRAVPFLQAPKKEPKKAL